MQQLSQWVVVIDDQDAAFRRFRRLFRTRWRIGFLMQLRESLPETFVPGKRLTGFGLALETSQQDPKDISPTGQNKQQVG
jgi:hypothetical protein